MVSLGLVWVWVFGVGFWVGLRAWDLPTEREHFPGPPFNSRAAEFQKKRHTRPINANKTKLMLFMSFAFINPGRNVAAK